jgi:N-carbamoylputrescine amidase
VEEIRLIRAPEPPESLARTRPPSRPPFRIGAVQHRWHEDPEEHEAALAEGIRIAAGEGAKLVCLQ